MIEAPEGTDHFGKGHRELGVASAVALEKHPGDAFQKPLKVADAGFSSHILGQ